MLLAFLFIKMETLISILIFFLICVIIILFKKNTGERNDIDNSNSEMLVEWKQINSFGIWTTKNHKCNWVWTLYNEYSWDISKWSFKDDIKEWTWKVITPLRQNIEYILENWKIIDIKEVNLDWSIDDFLESIDNKQKYIEKINKFLIQFWYYSNNIYKDKVSDLLENEDLFNKFLMKNDKKFVYDYVLKWALEDNKNSSAPLDNKIVIYNTKRIVLQQWWDLI